jgi:hypothetical protein
MPIEPIPLEQEVEAEATKFTLDPTVVLLDGLDTVTPANAELPTKTKTEMAVEIRACFFICTFSLRLGLVWDR